MGKRITQQARGRGGPAFKVRKKAYLHKIGYPRLDVEGKAIVSKLIGSAGHSAPLALIKINGNKFVVPAANGVYEGQEIFIGKRPENKRAEIGDVVRLKDEFVFVATHELRAPVTAINGHLEMILDDKVKFDSKVIMLQK